MVRRCRRRGPVCAPVTLSHRVGPISRRSPEIRTIANKTSAGRIIPLRWFARVVCSTLVPRQARARTVRRATAVPRQRRDWNGIPYHDRPVTIGYRTMPIRDPGAVARREATSQPSERRSERRNRFPSSRSSFSSRTSIAQSHRVVENSSPDCLAEQKLGRSFTPEVPDRWQPPENRFGSAAAGSMSVDRIEIATHPDSSREPDAVEKSL